MLTKISGLYTSLNFDPKTSLLSVLLVLLFWRFFSRNRAKELLSKLPGPKPLPIIGNSLAFLVPREQRMKDIIARGKAYGSIYIMWLGHIPNVVLAAPEYIETVLHSSKHLEKGFGYLFLRPFLGFGLITANGHRWLTHRKILTPAFHFKILDSFLGGFRDHERIFVEKLDKMADTGEAFDIYSYVKHFALDVLCETAMGVKVHAQEKVKSDYVHSVLRISTIISNRFTSFWLHPDVIFNATKMGREQKKHLAVVHGFVDNVIQERKKIIAESGLNQHAKNGEEGGKARLAFLDLLLKTAAEEKIELTDQDIRDEVDTFMFAGHDTTTAAITWVIYLLGLHPEIQNQVYLELKEIFGDDMNRPILQEDLAKMNYLERVMKESIRMYPSVPGISRMLEEDVQFGKYTVPKGTTVILQIYMLHQNPKIFPNPEKFDPDRFLPENVASRHNYAYVPFSAGPRNCIGKRFALMEQKFILASIFRRYKVESLEQPENLKLVAELILRSMSGIQVRVRRRGTA